MQGKKIVPRYYLHPLATLKKCFLQGVKFECQQIFQEALNHKFSSFSMRTCKFSRCTFKSLNKYLVHFTCKPINFSRRVLTNSCLEKLFLLLLDTPILQSQTIDTNKCFSPYYILCCTVSILGREEGYTVKYSLSPRAIPRAQALFYRISRLES